MEEKHEKLFNDNEKLVYFVVKNKYTNLSNLPNYITYDDVVQHGMIGLMKAARTFKEEKGFSFATYATRCIMNEISMMFRKYRETREVSLEQILTDEENITIFDTMCDERDTIEERIHEMHIENVFNNMLRKSNINTQKALHCMMEGKTQIEASEELGVSQSYVSRLIKGFKNEYKAKVSR